MIDIVRDNVDQFQVSKWQHFCIYRSNTSQDLPVSGGLGLKYDKNTTINLMHYFYCFENNNPKSAAPSNDRSNTV